MSTSLILCVALGLAGQLGEASWETIRYPEGGFAVEMPGGDQVMRSEWFNQNHDGAPYAYFDSVRNNARRGPYLVSIIKVRGGIAPATRVRWLLVAREKGARAGFNVKVESEKKNKLGDLDVYDSKIVEGGVMGGTTWTRSIVKGDTIVTLVGQSRPKKGETEAGPPAEVARFFDSFAFGNKPRAPKPTVEAAEGGAGAPWVSLTLAKDRAKVDAPREPTKQFGGGREEAPLDEFSGHIQIIETPAVFLLSGTYHGVPREGAVAAVAPADQAKAIENSIDNIAGLVECSAKVTADRAFTSPTAGAGHDFDAIVTSKAKEAHKARGRAFFDGDRVYVLLAASTSKGKDVPADGLRYLDSMTITGRGSAGPDAAPGAGPPATMAAGPLAMASAGMSASSILLGPAKARLLFALGRLAGSMPIGRKPPAGMAAGGAAEMPPAAVVVAPEPRRPAPAAAGAMKGWGREVDPAGDVAFRVEGKSLSMEIPGSAHVFAPERSIMNAPRVVEPMKGPFEATVRVVGAFRPLGESTVKGLSNREAAGLLIWKDAGNYLVFQHRATLEKGGAVEHQAVLEELSGGSKGSTIRQDAGNGPMFLRLARRKGKILASYSFDNRTWKELKPVDAPWAEGEVEVGVVGVSTNPDSHSVTFDRYSVKGN